MKYILLPALVSVSFLIVGCSGTKETLGLNRQAPDEFAVVKRAPLALPPDYALRAPEPGAPRPQEQATSTQAQIAVFGSDSVDKAVLASSGESSLLASAGVDQVDTRIRQTIDAESRIIQKDKRPVVDKLIGLAGKETKNPAQVVDARKEAERLKTKADGATPSIEN